MGRALGSFPLTCHTTLSLCFPAWSLHALGIWKEGRKAVWAQNSVKFLYHLLLPTERINIFMENTAQTYTSFLREGVHESVIVGEHGDGICPSRGMICSKSIFGKGVQTTTPNLCLGEVCGSGQVSLDAWQAKLDLKPF